jgi:hypothetical protein
VTPTLLQPAQGPPPPPPAPPYWAGQPASPDRDMSQLSSNAWVHPQPSNSTSQPSFQTQVVNALLSFLNPAYQMHHYPANMPTF